MYSAQYGRSGGGVISVVTNSGTKEFHGALYEYHRNKALDARPFFYTGSKKDQPGYLFNQFGGTVGGPVIKRRTFFFFSAEGFRQKKPGSLMIGFAPTEKERIGDLSESINPWTLKPVVLINPYTQEVIQDSKVPQSLINPVGKKLMDLWPKPNYSGDPFLNWRAFRGGSYNQNKLLIRMDHNLSARNVLSGTFNFGNYMDTSPANTQFGDMALHQDDRTLVLTYTRNFSTRLVNDLKFNYTRYLHGGEAAQRFADLQGGRDDYGIAHPVRNLRGLCGTRASALGLAPSHDSDHCRRRHDHQQENASEDQAGDDGAAPGLQP